MFMVFCQTLTKAINGVSSELRNGTYNVEAFNGTSKVEWKNDATLTPFGQMVFFY